MMAVLRITAIFFTILVLHNNYVSSRPDGQLSTAEAEDVTETQASEEPVTEIESFEDFESRKKRETDEEDSEDEESSEEESEEEYDYEDEEYYDEYEEEKEEAEEGVFHRVLDMAFDDVPTSADGLMEDYYLVI